MKVSLNGKKCFVYFKVMLISIIVFVLLALAFGGITKLLTRDYTITIKGYIVCEVENCREDTTLFESFKNRIEENINAAVNNLGLSYSEVKEMVTVINHGDYFEVAVSHDDPSLAAVVLVYVRGYIIYKINSNSIYLFNNQLNETVNFPFLIQIGVIIGLLVGSGLVYSRRSDSSKQIHEEAA